MSATNTATYIVNRLKSDQVSWTEIANRIDQECLCNDDDIESLACEIGEAIKTNPFHFERPPLRQLVDASVTGGLDKKETKKFVSNLITSGGFEDYSASNYSAHLARHFKKVSTSRPKKEKKAVSEVILGLLPNIESQAGYDLVLKTLLEQKDSMNFDKVVEITEAA